MAESTTTTLQHNSNGSVRKADLNDNNITTVESVRDQAMDKLSSALMKQTLRVIDLSQRQLQSSDAKLLKLALLQNPNLQTLKLSYNNLKDEGLLTFVNVLRSHPSLKTLDVGFNNLGDKGCGALASIIKNGCCCLETLYLAGNGIGERGALALGMALRGISVPSGTFHNDKTQSQHNILRPSSHTNMSQCISNGSITSLRTVMSDVKLKHLHLTGNRIGPNGVKGLAKAIAERDMERHRLMNMISNGSEGMVHNIESNDNQSEQCGDGGLQALHLGGTGMGSTGCLAISNMLLTNHSLRVLSLSGNGIGDKDIALFSQSLSRNKELPLEVLELSFNNLTCLGVEALMNAIWGSTTMKEIRLDNNRVADRGAQLVAVVLTSVDLQVLDMGFNKVTALGIKAMMKTLAENKSLQTLTLSGNPLDTSASKAVAYALAYNTSLTTLFVDNCSVSFQAQRHITAGIVSNSHISLRSLTGFRLGSIVITLGFNAAIEQWTNEKILRFVQLMWEKEREDNKVESSGVGNMEDSSESGNDPVQKSAPIEPSIVLEVAKRAYDALQHGDGLGFIPGVPQAERSFSSPLVSYEQMILEDLKISHDTDSLTSSVQLKLPPVPPNLLNEIDQDILSVLTVDDLSSQCGSSEETMSVATGFSSVVMDPIRKRRNSEWICQHFKDLGKLTQKSFNENELIQLHDYFFCSIEERIFRENGQSDEMDISDIQPTKRVATTTKGILPQFSTNLPPKVPAFSRKYSFKVLSDAAIMSSNKHQFEESKSSIISRRRNLSSISLEKTDGEDQMSHKQMTSPANKRARSDKPRIEYFPRIKEKLEAIRKKGRTHHGKALVILRQLRYIEDELLEGDVVEFLSRGDENDSDSSTMEFGVADVEMILLDLM